MVDRGSGRDLSRTVVVHDDPPSTPHTIGAAVIFSVILVIAAVAALAYIALTA